MHMLPPRDAIWIGARGRGIREWAGYGSIYYRDWYIEQNGINSGWLTDYEDHREWDYATAN